MSHGLTKLMKGSGTLTQRLTATRARMAERLLAALFGRPMQAVPQGSHVNLAGAVVLWYLQDGFKQFIMVRSPEFGAGSHDGRSRFVSCLGLGTHASMPLALRGVLETQLGKLFAGTLSPHALDADRLVAAPMFSYTNEENGQTAPVQTLLWVVQVQAAQAELIEAGPGLDVVTVPEFALSSQKVSATHHALWQAVNRHIPKGRLRDGVKLDDAAVEEAIKDVTGQGGETPRTVH